LIGGVVFVIVFLIFTLLSAFAFPSLSIPPAETILGWFGIDATAILQHGDWIIGLVNGVIYGVIVWVAFSVVNLAVKGKKKEEVKFASCPKCKDMIVARKTWIMMGRPDRLGKRMRLEIGLFDCPRCDITFRRILSKGKV